MKIIDPHIHLFHLSQGEYQWLKPNNAPFWPDKPLIHRDFFEKDLRLKAPLSLAGFVHIEAGFNNQQPWHEIQWLEQHCQKAFKSIAYVDLNQTHQSFIASINQLKQYPSFVGIRHILDMPNISEFLQQQNVPKNLHYLAQQGLIFECQLALNNQPAVTALTHLLNDLPLTVIINHAGFPIKNNISDQQWRHSLEQLSKITTVAIKCSGFEMNNRHYQLTEQQSIIECCLNYFGDKRVMLASNFPLTLLSTSYHQYWLQLSQLSFSQQQQLFFENSYTWYQFNH